MSKKRRAAPKVSRPSLSPEQVAEERITKWIRFTAKARGWNGGDEHAHYSGAWAALDLKNLGLKRVPESLSRVRGIEVVELAGNEIQELPQWIGNLSGLLVLDLTRNRLRTLPPQIGSLNSLLVLLLANNNLNTLPATLNDLSLERLHLHGNPDLKIPESIIGSLDAGEILRYHSLSRDDDGEPLLELKLMLVGRPLAGKTTLVKRLAGEEPSMQESETPSVAIQELTIECDPGSVRVRAWDFGGQEKLTSTHQFFLTERSLYLLVLEPRSGLAQRDAEYWLKLIETQGGSSPVIVVLNWSHRRQWQVDQVRLRRKFPFILAFLRTDALNGDGIEELRQTIQKAVRDSMPEVWLPFPQRWREIKDEVAGMSDNFMTYNEYTALCASRGETDETAQADLARILHHLGLALYFGNDPRLRDKRVLNPGWVTGGVYAVIRSGSVAEKNGQLTVNDMPQVLREAEEQQVIKADDYPVETHQFILELMRAFQLCYASEEAVPGRPTRYLVPELLPEFEPQMDQPWETAPVHLRYRYEVLPPGLVPRFIVRTHALSDGEPHWRHGVVLRHSDATTLIRAETDPPELHVFVVGGNEERCSVLVAMVRRELETLHAELKMQAIEELELTGEGAQWISVKALREVERTNTPTQRLPIQPEGTAEVNVTRELDKLLPEAVRAIDRDPGLTPVPVRVFVSYAHDDERQLKRLDLILDVLEQQHGLASWRDKRLIAGEEWNEEICRRLSEMDIFLFIASQTSMVRPYIKDPELRIAKERHAQREVEVVVVKLEECACDNDEFLGRFQRLGPVLVSHERYKSSAWEQVRKDLLPVIENVRRRKMAVLSSARNMTTSVLSS